jgi:hypothetical protein
LASIFITEAGTPPYRAGSDGSLTINVPSLQVALDGSRTSVTLSVDKITDNTVPDPTTYVKYTSASPQVTPYTTLAAEDEPPSFFSFSFPDHEVRHTTISRVTWSSIMSQLGGLAGLAVGYIWLLWKGSGFLNAKDQEMYVFKYYGWLPQEARVVSWLRVVMCGQSGFSLLRGSRALRGSCANPRCRTS